MRIPVVRLLLFILLGDASRLGADTNIFVNFATGTSVGLPLVFSDYDFGFDGGLVHSSNYVAQLFYSKDGTNFTAVAPGQPFFDVSPASVRAGLWTHIDYGLPAGVMPGDRVTLKVAVWDGTLFPTWEDAVNETLGSGEIVDPRLNYYDPFQIGSVIFPYTVPAAGSLNPADYTMSNFPGLRLQAYLGLGPPLSGPGSGFHIPPNFNTDQNSIAGPWTYGYETSVGGPLIPFEVAKVSPADNGLPLFSWSDGRPGSPEVFCNTNAATAISDGGAGVYPSGTVVVRPGLKGNPGNYGAVRFTTQAEAAGAYSLSVRAKTRLDGALSRGADFHVLYRGAEVFRVFMAPNSTTDYGSYLILNAGDTVDFLAGRGADGAAAGSGLKIDVGLARAFYTAAISSPRQGGFFTNSTTVELVCNDPGAMVRYTLDGSDPGPDSFYYQAPVTISRSAILRARAYRRLNYPISEIWSAEFHRVYAWDSDGIDPAWRQRYFGTNYATNIDAAAAADPDGDGIDNLHEFLAGKNPLAPDSALPQLRIEKLLQIAWSGESGINYRVQRQAFGAPGWTDLQTNSATASGTLAFEDSGADGSALYRVVADASTAAAPLLTAKLVSKISWTGASGVKYRVQRRYGPIDSWTDLSPDVVGAGGGSSILDSQATEPAFYRIIIP